MGTSISGKINNIYMMATNKEDNIVDSLVKAGALLGGAWLAIELVKAFSREVYRCPHCNNIVQIRVTPCPYCGVPLTWNL